MQACIKAIFLFRTLDKARRTRTSSSSIRPQKSPILVVFVGAAAFILVVFIGAAAFILVVFVGAGRWRNRRRHRRRSRQAAASSSSEAGGGIVFIFVTGSRRHSLHRGWAITGIYLSVPFFHFPIFDLPTLPPSTSLFCVAGRR
ncbi:hypothetical protein ACLOJK_013594 [Asimina triloba]